MSLPIGEIAALLTACCWTGSSLAFSAAGRRMGSLTLNLVRLVIAFALITIICFVRRGTLLPFDIPLRNWGWLLASGFVGYVIGDICLFRAFVLIGPRLSMLIMALAPPLTAVLGFFLLNERISTLGVVGMIVTTLGVVWVVRERPESKSSNEETTSADSLKQGVLLGLGGAAGQAGGIVLSKEGMGNFDAIASGQIRVIAGIVGFSLIFTLIGWWKNVLGGVQDATAMKFASLGAFIGPVCGVSLSLFAVQHTETGIAATIMSTSPVLIIPILILSGQERVSARAGFGTIIAVIGVAMLCIR